MKDAFGHGSDGNGGSIAKGLSPSSHARYMIQKLNPTLAGNPWQVVQRFGNKIVAERTAMRMATDDRRTPFRVK